MEGIKLAQSLPICISLAATGGALEVAATAVTAIPAVREKEGMVMSKPMQLLAIAGNVLLQGIGSILGHLVATWFGPVALVVPFFFSATLLCNMLIVGILREPFSKNMQVGTLVIVVAVIMLPSVGPTTQEDQDIGELMSHWYAKAWFMLLVILSFGTGILLPLHISKYSQTIRMVILLAARASSLCVNLTVSRSFILGPSGVTLIILVVIKLLSGFIYTTAIVVQSFSVEQSKFVPLNATLIILVNAITGIIIWEDWRVVQSWVGYVCVFALLGLGCDLLLSVPLLSSENPDFGVGRRASMIPPVHRRVSKLISNTRLVAKFIHKIRPEPLIDFDYDDDDEPVCEDAQETEDQKLAQTQAQGYNNEAKASEHAANETHLKKAERRKSRVEAWREIMNPSTRSTTDNSIAFEGASSVLQSSSSPGFSSSIRNQKSSPSTMGNQAHESTTLFGA
jgi:hypothetical protein